MRKFQTGATMIEVMISVLIISIGLLGVAGTQTLGLANSQSALHRSYAAQLSYELADAMRLSPSNLANYDGYSTDPSVLTQPADRDTDNCFIATKGCVGANMVSAFLTDWEAKVENNLPDGRASINLESSFYVVNIEWKDLRTNQVRQDANQLAIENQAIADGESADEAKDLAEADAAYVSFTTSFQL